MAKNISRKTRRGPAPAHRSARPGRRIATMLGALGALASLAAAQTVSIPVLSPTPAAQLRTRINGQLVIGLDNILNHADVTTVVLEAAGDQPIVTVDYDEKVTIPAGKTLENGGSGQVQVLGLNDPVLGHRKHTFIELKADATLRGLYVEADNEWHLIGMDGVSGATVEDCQIVTYQQAINLESTTACNVIGNHIEARLMFVYPGNPRSPFGSGYGVRDHLGIGNWIDSNSISAQDWFNLRIPNTEPTRPQCCRSPFPPFDGIAAYATMHCTIIGNDVSYCNAAGIYIYWDGVQGTEGMDNVVSQNQVTQTVQYGIDCAKQMNFIIEANTVSKTWAAGIMTASSSGGVVRGNNVSEADYLASPLPTCSGMSCKEVGDYSAALLIREGNTNCSYVNNVISAAPASNGTQAKWAISLESVPVGQNLPTGNTIGSPNQVGQNVLYKGWAAEWVHMQPSNTLLNNIYL